MISPVSPNRIRVLPSLLSAPFDRLGESVKELETEGCRLLHVDVMDGHFVPNLTMGPVVIDGLRPACESEFDVHLMVTNPSDVVPWFELERVRSITVHAEADAHLHALLKRIRDKGRLAGLSFNPGTPLDCLPYLLDQIDLVLIMSVNPGFGGQSFIEPMLDKIRETEELRRERHANFIIQVDGGIGVKTIEQTIRAGAEELVAGSAVFGDANPAQAFRGLSDLAWKAADRERIV